MKTIKETLTAFMYSLFGFFDLNFLSLNKSSVFIGEKVTNANANKQKVVFFF